jgi:hypothetical protein
LLRIKTKLIHKMFKENFFSVLIFYALYDWK